jgi:hypothetical protein
MHSQTIACVGKAKVLMAKADVDSLRYAALQLRMGIEYLFYELIPLYKDELPDDIMKLWQPAQIISALLDCDPAVDQDAEVRLFPGDRPPGEGTPFLARKSKAVNKRILRDHYHRLGSHMHAPVDLAEPVVQKWIDALTKTIACLGEYTMDQMLSNVSSFVTLDCDCGRRIKKNRHAIDVRSELRCPGPTCGAVYDCVVEEGGSVSCVQRQFTFQCPYCKEPNDVPIHRLKAGIEITCAACERRSVANTGWFVSSLDE